MENTQVSFKNVLASCVENNVDFEVWHGKTTQKTHTIRRQMLITASGKPTLFVTFGDPKHGELVSVITVSSNKDLTVTKDELLETISSPNEVKSWSNSELSSEITAEANLQVLDRNTRKVRVNGAVVQDISTNDEYKYIFNLERSFYTIDSTEYKSVTPIILKSVSKLEINKEIYTEGIYSYPNTVSALY